MGAAEKRKFSRLATAELATQDHSRFGESQERGLDDARGRDYSPITPDERYAASLERFTNSPAHTSRPSIEFETLTSLEYRLGLVESPTIPPRERAREVLYILRQLLWSESGYASLEDGGEKFFQTLHAEPWMREFFEGLFRAARSAINVSVVGSAGETRLKSSEFTAQDIDIILSWYIRRKRTLEKLFVPPNSSEISGQIIEAEIFPDSSMGGTPAILISASFFVAGGYGQRLWTKAHVSSHHSFVHARNGWETWRDQTQGVIASEDVDARFCTTQPLRAALHEQVFENTKLYIPHEALDLEPGLHNLNIELELVDDRGTVLSSEIHPLQIRLVKSYPAQLSSALPMERQESSIQEDALSVQTPRFVRFSPWGIRWAKVPSPQSIGVWSLDPVSNSQLIHYTLRKVNRCLKGRAYECVRALLDLELHGQVGQTFAVRLNLYQQDGREVGLIDSYSGEDDRAPVERILVLEQPVQRFHGVNLEVPVDLLDFAPGHHSILVEACVHSSDARVVCGAMRRTECTVRTSSSRGDSPDKMKEALELIRVGAPGVLSVSRVEAELNLADAEPEISISAEIHSSRKSLEFYKVEVALTIAAIESDIREEFRAHAEVIGIALSPDQEKIITHVMPLSAFQSSGIPRGTHSYGSLEISVKALDGSLLATHFSQDCVEIPNEVWESVPKAVAERKSVSLKQLSVRGDPLKKFLGVDVLIEFLAQPELWGGLVFMELLDRNGEPFATTSLGDATLGAEVSIESGKILPLAAFGEVIPQGLEGALIHNCVQAEFDLTRAFERRSPKAIAEGSFYTEYRLKILVFSRKGFLEASFERPLSLMTVSSSDDLLAPPRKSARKGGWREFIRNVFPW